jgi:hypothetical protein
MDTNEAKARLMADLETEIDTVLAARDGEKRLTLTEIEDVVLAARERLGKKLAETLVREQEAENVTKAPISPVSGKPLQRKDKKRRQSKHG